MIGNNLNPQQVSHSTWIHKCGRNKLSTHWGVKVKEFYLLLYSMALRRLSHLPLRVIYSMLHQTFNQ